MNQGIERKALRPSKLPRWLLRIIGLLAVALGFIGAFLPLLPTTPFLLLAAACFVRSSPKLYRWLMTHKWFGPLLYNYRTYRAVPRSSKIGTLVLLWATIGYSVCFIAQALWLRVLLLVIAIGVSVHVLSLKTMPINGANLGRDKFRRQPESEGEKTKSP